MSPNRVLLKLSLIGCTVLVLLLTSDQLVSSQSGDGDACGQLTTVQMPFNFVFIPDGAESSDPETSWWVVDENIKTAGGERIDIYHLEDKYLRVWIPNLEPASGDLWGYPVPLLVSVADYQVVANCEFALSTPTAIPTSSINHLLTAASVPWATRCVDESTACFPYHLSIDDLPAEWQPLAVNAATLWAEAIPQLQFTQGSLDQSTRTLVPYGVKDWMLGQPLGDLRLAVGEIRIVPESALAPLKLNWETVAVGIAYTDQTRFQHPR